MTDGNLHPSDEDVARALLKYIRSRICRLGPGDMLTVEIPRGKNNRITFRGVIAENNPHVEEPDQKIA